MTADSYFKKMGKRAENINPEIDYDELEGMIAEIIEEVKKTYKSGEKKNE